VKSAHLVDKLDDKILPDMGVKVASWKMKAPKKKDSNAVVARPSFR